MDIAVRAKKASRELAKLSSESKNKILLRMAEYIRKQSGLIREANLKDLKEAEKRGLASSLIDRLTLTDERIEQMAHSIEEVANLADPCEKIDKMWKRPNGLIIGKMRVPIGVIGIIYESRPNVTADCASLCLKSGNAVILKGGKEAVRSNLSIYRVLREAIVKEGMNADVVSMVDSTDRKSVSYLLKQEKYIDLIIPRGGEGLIRKVSEESSIPVIKHYKGVCHIYVDASADIDKALNICINAKVQRPGVCNAMETLLIDKRIAEEFLPLVSEKMQAAGVQLRGCAQSCKLGKGISAAKESDWAEEYLDLVLAIKVVDGVDGAIEHINTYGSNHSDAIVAEDFNLVLKFLKEVDSSSVYSNASTRFTDGFEFGFGAEIGISTDKIHARGPMALEELTTYKYIIFGNGQTRE
ncbi:MAG: glutamate-5-semialdehyde dehydrogenase [Candidatus Omnitrophota bacterium]